MNKNTDCVCFHPPFFFESFTSTLLGIDFTHGRFGEVTIEKCKTCQRLWLRYFVEYEAFPNSGRWYRGQISEEEIPAVSPESAIDFLEKLDWYFCGGSYFGTTGQIGKGTITVDL